MIAILSAILPVFLLIALGYGAAKRNVISAEGAKGIDAFVFHFAIPALLFRTMLAIDMGDAAPWGLWAAYYSGVAVIWACVGVFALTVRAGVAAGGSAMATASSFGNGLLMGIPVSLLHFGQEAVIPAGLLISIHAPLHWLFGTLWAESALHKGESHIGKLLGQVGLSMARNPMILALGLGLIWNLSGFGLHPILERLIDILADSSIGAALFALGLSLASYSIRGNVRVLSAILILKLLAFPAVMFLLARGVFDLPPAQQHVAILFSALPVGVNAYIFATKYNANVGAISSAIMLSVPLSALTLPVVLYLIG